MDTPQNPNLQTIADLAGVSRAAVSLALRNQPGISLETRERIQKIAEGAGYRPNPMVSALMAHLKGVQPAPTMASIPFLTSHSTRQGWREYETFVRYFEGAAARAEQSGYRLDEIWTRELGVTSRKLKSIFVNRGIQGVLIGPLPRGLGHLSLDLSTFSTATVGHSLVRPKLHRAVSHHIASVRAAIHHMRHLGYRRIALVLEDNQDLRNDFNWSTAFAGYQLSVPASLRIPILTCRGSNDRPFQVWLEKWKPEGILSGNSVILEMLARAGKTVPDDVGVAILDRSRKEEHLAGIDQKLEMVGAAAVDLIISQINRNERGIPPNPKHILIEGVWHMGSTLRKISNTKSVSATARGSARKKRAVPPKR
jgi:LacI family transcriptional regulator